MGRNNNVGNFFHEVQDTTDIEPDEDDEIVFGFSKDAILMFFAGVFLFSVIQYNTEKFNINLITILLGYTVSAYRINCNQLGGCKNQTKTAVLLTFTASMIIAFFHYIKKK